MVSICTIASATATVPKSAGVSRRAKISRLISARPDSAKLSSEVQTRDLATTLARLNENRGPGALGGGSRGTESRGENGARQATGPGKAGSESYPSYWKRTRQSS